MNQHTAIWNVERVELLKTLNAERMSFRRIAECINQQTSSEFTRCSCIGKARRLGLVVGPRPRGGDLATRKQRGPDLIRKAPRNKWLYTMAREPEQTQKPYAFLGIAFDDLKSQSCRYPMGNSPFTFCGQRKMKGSSYCPHCHKLCYMKPRSDIARLKVA